MTWLEDQQEAAEQRLERAIGNHDDHMRDLAEERAWRADRRFYHYAEGYEPE